MSNISSFNAHHHQYDQWFVNNRAAYYSELLAVRAMLPYQGKGLEIGVGTGRFAGPLGVRFGIEPAGEMLKYSAERGVDAVQGLAEDLPFGDSVFDYILMVTTLCFFDDVPAVLAETRRILKQGGLLVVGFINRNSDLGRYYQHHKEESAFYRDASFFSAEEVGVLLSEAGFLKPRWCQTLYKSIDEAREIEPLRPGYGQGAFVGRRVSCP